MGLCTMPVRFGLPDLRTDQGRAMSAGPFTGKFQVRGRPLGPSMMTRLTRQPRVVE